MNKTIINDAKFLAGYIYHNEKYKDNRGFQLLEKIDIKENGFYAESYYKDGKLYIVYKGTDDLTKNFKEWNKDLKNDIQLSLLKKIPGQKIYAENFYDYNARKYRNIPIYLTGHSLGGSLAQIIGSLKKESKAITFNAYGVKNIKNFTPKYKDNIINYGNSSDIIFNANIKNHIGETFVIQQEDKKIYGLKHHPVEYIGNLDKAQKYNQNKQIIEYKKINSIKNKVDEMFQQHEEKLKRKKQEQKSSGPVHVRAYTKKDGTDVCSHYRSK